MKSIALFISIYEMYSKPQAFDSTLYISIFLGNVEIREQDRLI